MICYWNFNKIILRIKYRARETGNGWMGLLRNMKQMEGLTEREQMIRNYMVEHPEQICGMSSRELGEATFSSAAAVVRFCQKLGYKGYADFKIQFLSELKVLDSDEYGEVIRISEQENIVSMLGKINESYKKAIEETKREISLEQMVRISEMLHRAEYVDFYAFDTNVGLAQYASSQLFYAGKVANVYSATNVQILNALMKHENHLAIIISHTGENSRLIEVAKSLKRMKTKTVIITSDRKRTLSQMGNEVLCASAPTKLDELWTTMFTASAKYLLDVMFGLEFSYHYQENMKRNKEYEVAGRTTLWGLKNDV